MYKTFVWWLYSVVYGNETIEREDGDTEVFNRVLAQYNRQRRNWARMFNTTVHIHPQSFKLNV